MNQKTIKNSATISGVGIHTGVHTNLTLVPAKANTGIRFIRTDLEGKPTIPANVDYVFSTNRSTNLKIKNSEVYTVEHVLAAIVAEGIDNIIIEVDNMEVPILDGSSIQFSELISEVGIQELNKRKKFFEIKRKICFTDHESGTTFTAIPAENYQIEVEIDYNSTVLGRQTATLENLSEFKGNIASSRTFCFLHELEELLELEDPVEDDPLAGLVDEVILDPTHMRVNFPPFFHYRVDTNKETKVVILPWSGWSARNLCEESLSAAWL